MGHGRASIPRRGLQGSQHTGIRADEDAVRREHRADRDGSRAGAVGASTSQVAEG